MKRQGWTNFMAFPLSWFDPNWLFFVGLHKRQSVQRFSLEHKWTEKQNKRSMCFNKSSFSAENLRKHEISIKLRCARTRKTLRTSFKLITRFIGSSSLLHIALIKLLRSGQNNGPFRIGGFFAHPVYWPKYRVDLLSEIKTCRSDWQSCIFHYY